MNIRSRIIASSVIMAAIVAVAVALLLSGMRAARVTAESRCQYFQETGHVACGKFLAYWQAHGGLAQYGFPISDPFLERNAPPPAGDSQDHTVQYFQRARFEDHPENQPPYDVLLGLLGAEQLGAKYGGGTPGTNTSRIVTLNATDKPTTIGATSPKSGAAFLVVDVTLTNLLEQKFDSKPDGFSIVTVSGATIKPSAATAALDTPLPVRSLDTDDSVRGSVAFEIPIGDSPIALLYDSYPAQATISLPPK